MTVSRKQPKPKKCRACRSTFTPARPLQAVCSVKCAATQARVARERENASQERKERKERKEKLKTYGDHIADAEKAVRDYRRMYELSIGSPCISCGKSQEEVRETQGWKIGGAWDGGHWMGKGARPELRLEPDNIWLQCKGCNGGSAKYARKGESVKEGFEAGVIARLGEEAAMALKQDHRARHYTVDQLKEITRNYRAKVRELKKESGE